MNLFTLEFESLDPYYLSMYGGFRLSDHETKGRTHARMFFPTLRDAMQWSEGTDATMTHPVTDPGHGVVMELRIK